LKETAKMKLKEIGIIQLSQVLITTDCTDFPDYTVMQFYYGVAGALQN
jgi:hypothetical protein